MLDFVPANPACDTTYGGKTLIERLTGRFYTPDVLASQLAESMLAAYECRHENRPLKLIDPFCGDGQLVAALLNRVSSDSTLARRAWRICLWDRDADALRKAASRIRSLVAELALSASIEPSLVDTFKAELPSDYDLVITNPPWELLKPDHREVAHLSPQEALNYRNKLRETSNALDDRFPDARALGAWAGWGTNLARCGWDVSMQLLGRGGVLGIVLPSTLFADQGSEPIRRKAFQQCRLFDVAAYPPEARLFDRVDQSIVSATFIAGATGAFEGGHLRVFDASRSEKLLVPLPKIAALAGRGYTLPVAFGAAASAVFDQIADLQTLSDLEGEAPHSLWLGRELDETRIREKTVPGLKHPFIKGRMIQRHCIVESPSVSVRADFASRFPSARFPRAVWRDVSRASQKRRMIGAVIPPGWIAGNSLHVAHFRDGEMDRTLALHGILSSFVLEFQVRSRLGTGHMSLGVVRQARIPNLTSENITVLARAVRANAVRCPLAAARLEIAVAKAYGLGPDALSKILDSFEKVDDVEKQRLLDPALWAGTGKLST